MMYYKVENDAINIGDIKNRWIFLPNYKVDAITNQYVLQTTSVLLACENLVGEAQDYPIIPHGS